MTDKNSLMDAIAAVTDPSDVMENVIDKIASAVLDWQAARTGGEVVTIHQYPEWPVVGFNYLVRFNGVWQFETYLFDQGDDGSGGGEYFWDRDDVPEGRSFDPEKDAWIDPSAITTHPTPAAAMDVSTVANAIEQAWATAEPEHSITKNPVSYRSTFADMARAAIAACNTPAAAVPETVSAHNARLISQSMSFLASAIKSGEAWSEQCEHIYDRAQETLHSLTAAPQPKHLDCGACPGDGSMCQTECRLSKENPDVDATPQPAGDGESGYSCHKCLKPTDAPGPLRIYVWCADCQASTSASIAQDLAQPPEGER
ncbi:hypothetical protein [uncultured Gilvimarinus sp.]|uniref:hypothetical protein n=1 Tax=uncultured Gilvimarinus sp. TaxID=1689143 RepID=UPI0030EF43AC